LHFILLGYRDNLTPCQIVHLPGGLLLILLGMLMYEQYYYLRVGQFQSGRCLHFIPNRIEHINHLDRQRDSEPIVLCYAFALECHAYSLM
jgi:hypothetical protein